MTACVLLFARAPRAEAGAKRLAGAAPLFALAHRRVAEAVRALPGVDLVVVGPASVAPASRRLEQRGRDLGERLVNAFADARALGYRSMLAVPGDVPGLGAPHMASAFRALEDRPTVLGPSPDGGVYLIGVRGPVDRLFAGVRWCTRFVLRDLVDRAGDVALLPSLADVDVPGDLDRLATDPALDPSVRDLARRVRRPVLPCPVLSPGGPRSRRAAAPDAQRGPPAVP